MTFTVPHYVPSFFWRFWLSNSGQPRTRQPRLHVYDVYNSDLFELKTPFITQRPVFQDLDSALDAGPRCALDQATNSFHVLESQAEAALSKLIDQVHHEGSSPSSQVSLESSELSNIIKFYVFLRFRNSLKYQEIIKELIEPSELSLSLRRHGSRGETIFSIYSPLYRQVRIVTILTAFTQFFETDIERLPSSPFSNEDIDSSRARKDPCMKTIDTHFWKFCRQVEICLGVPSEEDQEYIISDSCYGVLDASFGSGASVGTGTGPEQNPETESYDSFFPILPTLALYVLYTEHAEPLRGEKEKVNIDVGPEMGIDVFLRNAMVLSNVPYNQNRRPTHTFIPYNRMSPTSERDASIDSLSTLKMSSPSMLTSVSLPISQDAAAMLDSISPPVISPPVGVLKTQTHVQTQSGSPTPNAHLNLTTSGPKLYFHSLSSITKSISSYDEFRCRWIADKFIDYSRLKQRCRQKFCMEGVMKMLPIKDDIVVIDLTDEVQVVGNEPVAYGAFSDVWKGQWFDRIERKERGVAIKYLRQVMVRKVVRAKFLKRLQAEIVTWHQLNHRNLATLFGIIQNASSIGMVSLWCDNGTLGQFLKKHPDRNKLRLLVQVASGVAYLHRFNPPVVHGDLKGSNILIDSHEQAIITDFGLTKVMEDLTSSMSESSEDGDGDGGREYKVLSTSFFAGSTRWMAPELIQVLVEDEGGKIPKVTTFSDVYAFASVCLEIATGRLPYPHRTNDHSVTVDILRGIGPSRGAVFSSKQLGICVPSSSYNYNHSSPCPCSIGLSSSPPSSPLPSVGEGSGGGEAKEKEKGGEGEEHDCFRVILEQCWSQIPYLRPNMEEVLTCFVAMEG